MISGGGSSNSSSDSALVRAITAATATTGACERDRGTSDEPIVVNVLAEIDVIEPLDEPAHEAHALEHEGDETEEDDEEKSKELDAIADDGVACPRSHDGERAEDHEEAVNGRLARKTSSFVFQNEEASLSREHTWME